MTELSSGASLTALLTWFDLVVWFGPQIAENQDTQGHKLEAEGINTSSCSKLF